MAHLYEIAKAIEEFELDIDTETGEILNADELDKLEMDKREKIENVCLYIKNLRADAEAYKNEKDAFANREKQAKAKADWLAGYLQRVLAGDEYKSDKALVTYRKSDRVEVSDITVVPKEYLKYADPTVDKTAVKKAIKSGAEIAGCHVEVVQNIQIK